MNHIWSKYIQGTKTLYYTRKLRFDDMFSAQYKELFDLDETKKLKILEDEFIKLLYNRFEDLKLVIDKEHKVPGVISFILPEVNNQLYLKRLSENVAFSSGSACTIATDSTLLDHLGLGEYKSNFFRVAFGKNNNINEIKELEEFFI